MHRPYDAVRAGQLQRAQTIYTELKSLPEFIVAAGQATTVKRLWSYSAPASGIRGGRYFRWTATAVPAQTAGDRAAERVALQTFIRHCLPN